jgi:Sel1 repeat
MKAKNLALSIIAILSIARMASAAPPPDVLVTDQAGMRALAESGNRGVIRGTVSSVSIKNSMGSSYEVYIHFAGVENDRVMAVIGFPWMFEPVYGSHLAGLVGKTIDITSRARVESGDKIIFSAADTSKLTLAGAPPDIPKGSNEEVARLPAKERQAKEILIKAGENGNQLAQEELGYLYFNGREGVAQDSTKALFWLHKAANQNSLFANLMLARMFEYGLGVERDTDAAFAYYQFVEVHSSGELHRQIQPEWNMVDKQKGDEYKADKDIVWEEDEHGNPHRVRLQHPKINTPDEDYNEGMAMTVLLTVGMVAAMMEAGPRQESGGLCTTTRGWTAVTGGC